MTAEQALVFRLIGAVLTLTPEAARIYAPEGRLLEQGS